jgi:hypothetical protein
VTGQIARRGALVSGLGQTLDQHFAVALDSQLISVSPIDFRRYPQAIPTVLISAAGSRTPQPETSRPSCASARCRSTCDSSLRSACPSPASRHASCCGGVHGRRLAGLEQTSKFAPASRRSCADSEVVGRPWVTAPPRRATGCQWSCPMRWRSRRRSESKP